MWKPKEEEEGKNVLLKTEVSLLSNVNDVIAIR